MSTAFITSQQAALLNLKKIKGNCTCEKDCFSFAGIHTKKACVCAVHKIHKHNKSGYQSKPTCIDGNWFASKAESRRYQELKMMVLAREITELELQPVYIIEVNGVRICRYTADFRYINKDGKQIVEDVKSKRKDKHGDFHGTSQARDWPLRKKLMKAVHKIDVIEVYM